MGKLVFAAIVFVVGYALYVTRGGEREGPGRRRAGGGPRRGRSITAQGRRGGGVQRARGRLADAGPHSAAVPGALGRPPAPVHARQLQRGAVPADPDA